jgi:VWFA-related protein
MFNKGRANARCFLFALALSCIAVLTNAHGQQATPTPQTEEEIIRISSDLVQTDVIVIDKNGKFVEGLKPEQFEMTVDGKPQAVSFFDKVTAGTFDEEAQLAAARGRTRPDLPGASVSPLDRGRFFVLFLDDLHVQANDLARVRASLLRFVEEEMGQNDEAAIFTSSGQLGFLQQMTGDREVLRLAIKRIVSRYFDTRDTDRTPMTEMQALAIEHNDHAVFDYFVDQLLREMNMSTARARGAGARGRANSGGGGQLAQAETSVRARAKGIVTQANTVTKNTLSSLENVLRMLGALPGQKILFFISGGFFIDAGGSDTLDYLRKNTDAAARSGTIIYTLDAHGLLGTSAVTPDASTKVAFDPNNQLVTVNSAALTAYQEPLRTLAADTGGRAMLDNDIGGDIKQAMSETARYYLLAWRPEGDAGHGKFRRIEVKVKNRPDLVVRVRSGYTEEPPKVDTEKKKDKDKDKKKNPAEAELMGALKALFPRRNLPTSVSAGYMDLPSSEAQLTVSVEVDALSLGFKSDGTGEATDVDVAGAVVNDEGKAVSEFAQYLTIAPLQTTNVRRRVVYNYQQQLKPGLYQVRVAARDRRTGRAGSAMQWLNVPDVKKGGLALSSLFVGEAGDGSSQLSICADHRFARTSRLGFFLYVYNATRAESSPDVALQVQVFRDGQPVITKPLFKIVTAGMTDLARLPYGEDLSLNTLPAGRYVLQVTAIDRAAKTSASQRVNFLIE